MLPPPLQLGITVTALPLCNSGPLPPVHKPFKQPSCVFNISTKTIYQQYNQFSTQRITAYPQTRQCLTTVMYLDSHTPTINMRILPKSMFHFKHHSLSMNWRKDALNTESHMMDAASLWNVSQSRATNYNLRASKNMELYNLLAQWSNSNENQHLLLWKHNKTLRICRFWGMPQLSDVYIFPETRQSNWIFMTFSL